jgi:hypothetical protein
MPASAARSVTLLLMIILCTACAPLGGGGEAPRRGGPSGSRGGPTGMSGPGRADATPMRAADPMIALELELPSLKTDLRLTVRQTLLWSAFEREVRDTAQLARAHLKRLLDPRNRSEPDRDALGSLAALMEDIREQAEALRDVQARLKPLYDSLEPEQRRLFDRRFSLAQADPLGRQ